jgi:hypothetical protein
VKAEMGAKYPAFQKQIQMVGIPTVGYKNHLWLNLKAMRMQAGRCDLFKTPQVVIVKDKRPSITLARLKHELSHFIIAAAGLPDGEHEVIDR